MMYHIARMKTVPLTIQTSAVPKLLSLLDKISFDAYKIFRFRGIPFLFFYMAEVEESDDYSPAIFRYSTLTGGYDVYLFRGVPEDQRKRCLFHEVMEASLVAKGLEIQEAHELAKAEEESIFGPRELASA